MTRYLILELVLEHVASSGGVVRDVGLLDAAVHRPQASLFGQDAYPDLASKAAALLHSVAQNQALVDGNKRFALLCAHAFLCINGHRIQAAADEVFVLLNNEIPQGLDDIVQIARRLQIRPLEPRWKGASAGLIREAFAPRPLGPSG